MTQEIEFVVEYEQKDGEWTASCQGPPLTGSGNTKAEAKEDLIQKIHEWKTSWDEADVADAKVKRSYEILKLRL